MARVLHTDAAGVEHGVMSQIDHILERPDTYIGSTRMTTDDVWVVRGGFYSSGVFPDLVHEKTTYNPGIVRLFVELLMNATDNKARHPADVSQIDVFLHENGLIKVANDGPTIDAVLIGKDKLQDLHLPFKNPQNLPIYLPAVSFGTPFSGSNYNDSATATRLTSGRNGIGAKAVNVFSKRFCVNVMNATKHRMYTCVFENNMRDLVESSLTPTPTAKHGDWLAVNAELDLPRFGLTDKIDAGTLSVMRAQVLFASATLNDQLPEKKRVAFLCNSTPIGVKSLSELVKGLMPPDKQMLMVSSGDVTAIVAAASDVPNLSFVNNVQTTDGGRHEYAFRASIGKVLCDIVKKKLKKDITVAAATTDLATFVSVSIDKPEFASQTKARLTSAPPDVLVNLPASFIKQLKKSSIAEALLERMRRDDNKAIVRLSAVKTQRWLDIKGYRAAEHAGGKRAQECALIVTEGDSAASLAVNSISKDRAPFYGVFAIRGKLLNVRDAEASVVTKNAVVQNLCTILGLKIDTKYESAAGLNYGRVILMTDQDSDGSHIKGLLINLFACLTPTLLRVKGFLQQFITPIVVAREMKRQTRRMYFTQARFDADKPDPKKHDILYYKGLGTHTTAEGRSYFDDPKTHLVPFENRVEPVDEDAIALAFAEGRSDERKTWVAKAAIAPEIPYGELPAPLSYKQFVDGELVHYADEANERAIPSVVDGLKPAQRKVLSVLLSDATPFKNVKVAALAGRVTERTDYHHGETSLCDTIIGMAQDFVGANNLPLLAKQGQFGTRRRAGKDAAAARYLFTSLAPIAQFVFKEEDLDIVPRVIEGDRQLEQRFLLPVIPMLLVNGARGIGFGWSSNIPQHSLSDIIWLCYEYSDPAAFSTIGPRFNNFRGTVDRVNDTSFKIHADYTTTSTECSLEIRDLPPGIGIDDYMETTIATMRTPSAAAGSKRKANGAATGEISTQKGSSVITNAIDRSTETEVRICVDVPNTLASGWSEADIRRMFKLDATISTANMVLYDADFKIRRFESVRDIVCEFARIRLHYNEIRRSRMLAALEKKIRHGEARVQFIEAVCDHKINFQTSTRDSIVERIQQNMIVPAAHGLEDIDFLFNMTVVQMTSDRADALRKEIEHLRDSLRVLSHQTPLDMWHADLMALRDACKRFGVWQ